MKKLLALTLALVLAFSLCVPALAEEAEVGGYGYTVDGRPIPIYAPGETIPEDAFDRYFPTPEPKLTLVVNGVASDVAVERVDWTTYADAAALRAILGVKAAAPTFEGSVPIREAAENAGWDVEWYDDGHGDQQVCLWNKDAFAAEVAPKVEPFQKLWDAAMELSRSTLFIDSPRRAAQVAEVTFKRFDSMDGDKTYTLKLRAESVWHKGVLDCTVTFDAAQLLELLTIGKPGNLARDMDRKTLQGAGKAEFILDYNAGGMAWNIPLLGLLDEEMKGWHTAYDPDLAEAVGQAGGLKLAESLYGNMVDAAWLSGVERRENVDDTLTALGVFAGADNVKTAGSTVTWTLETGKVNSALSKLVGDGTGAFSLFKKCDLGLTFNAQGKIDLKLALRLDTDGILEAVMAEEDELSAIVEGLLDWLVGGADMELTATARGDADQAAETVKLHIKNIGVLDVTTQTTAKSTAQTPRQLAQVEREWVKAKP